MRFIPPTLHGKKVGEDPQGFVYNVFKVVDMGVTPREKEELPTYHLKDVAQVWYEEWRDERPLREALIYWEVFKATFLERFFLIKLRERKLV